MKSPPMQFHDDVAHDMVEEFADGCGEPRLAVVQSSNPVWRTYCCLLRPPFA